MTGEKGCPFHRWKNSFEFYSKVAVPWSGQNSIRDPPTSCKMSKTEEFILSALDTAYGFIFSRQTILSQTKNSISQLKFVKIYMK